MTKIKSITWMTALSLLSTVNAAALECNGLQNAASSELVSYLRRNIPNQGNAECVAFAINRGAALLRAEVRSYGRTENAVKRAAG